MRKMTEEELKAIEEDSKRTHVVYFMDCTTDDEGVVEEEIESGLTQIGARALAAGMAITSTTFTQSSHAVGEVGHVAITIVAQWINREALERMQLQQRLMGQQNGGR